MTSNGVSGAPTETAVFAMGCFWSPDAMYGATKGVIRTKVGYAGGKIANPTYRSIKDHTEVIQIDFDPSKISYQDLLNSYWEHHDPTVPMKVQYRSMILYTSEKHKKIAEASLKEQESKHKNPVITIIAPLDEFYDAEDYHQKYRLRQHRDLCNDLAFKSEDEYKSSHLAARLNGYVDGFGGAKQFEEEAAGHLKLNEEMKDYVHYYVKKNEGKGYSC